MKLIVVLFGVVGGTELLPHFRRALSSSLFDDQSFDDDTLKNVADQCEPQGIKVEQCVLAHGGVITDDDDGAVDDGSGAITPAFICSLAAAWFTQHPQTPCADLLGMATSYVDDDLFFQDCQAEIYDTIDCALSAACPVLSLTCESITSEPTTDELAATKTSSDDDPGAATVWIPILSVLAAIAGAALIYLLYVFRDKLSPSGVRFHTVDNDVQLTDLTTTPNPILDDDHRIGGVRGGQKDHLSNQALIDQLPDGGV